MIPETRVERRAVADLTPADYNPRQISDRALAGLRESVTRFGLVQPIIVNQRTGNVVGGHQRLKVLGAEGVTDTDVVVVDIEAKEERALNVALNNPHISGDFTDDLDSMLSAIASDTPELFDALRLDDLLDALSTDIEAPPPLPEDDGGAELEDGPPVTQRGDIWVMGRHRLICGDCRDAGDVGRLLDGDRVNVAFTSPPYASQRTYDESSGFKPIPPDEYVEWFRDVQANVRANLADDGSWFVNITSAASGGAKHTYVKRMALEHVDSWGWVWVDEFCWPRPALPLNPNMSRRFKNAWESVFHFAAAKGYKFNPDDVRHKTTGAFVYAEQKAAGKLIGGDSQGKGGGIMSPVGQHDGLAYPSNVLGNFGGARVVGHSAAFPVGLPAFFIRAYSDEGDVIFDPFMGSGTTIIACEKEGRRGYGCEISAGYCDVIVRRWQECAGETAALDGDGRSFDEVKGARDAEG